MSLIRRKRGDNNYGISHEIVANDKIIVVGFKKAQEHGINLLTDLLIKCKEAKDN